MTQNELFAPENGARGTTAKILIVLTDGSQTPDPDAENPGLIADEIRDKGVQIVAVGVGNGTNVLELDHIAGGWWFFWGLEISPDKYTQKTENQKIIELKIS